MGQTMLKWHDILRFISEGNPRPQRTVTRSDEEWRSRLTPEQYRVTRQRGTERPFSSEMCSLFEPGWYACVGCGTVLFHANDKFESGSGWPSFTQPITESAIAYHADNAHGMQRVETTCNTCGAHLGHVFPDGPDAGGLRYCINAVALEKTAHPVERATFGGGCFWCTEAVFQQLKGVAGVQSGYSGGHTVNPTYHEVCTGSTGHAEVVQITFDPQVISYADLVRVHLGTHDPTTLNRQGADRGTQYRSIILTHDRMQEETSRRVIEEMAPAFEREIVTEVKPYENFYEAETAHRDYYAGNPEQPYCRIVISPKLEKVRKLFREKLKPDAV
jgi:peptide methionine sulfoxide reductase msrA/msrB